MFNWLRRKTHKRFWMVIRKPMKDCSDIRNSPRPVSTALTLATKRLGVEMGLHPAPAPAVALEGLKIEGGN